MFEKMGPKTLFYSLRPPILDNPTKKLKCKFQTNIG